MKTKNNDKFCCTIKEDIKYHKMEALTWTPSHQFFSDIPTKPGSYVFKCKESKGEEIYIEIGEIDGVMWTESFEFRSIPLGVLHAISTDPQWAKLFRHQTPQKA